MVVEKHKHCVVCGVSVTAEKEPPICGKKCEYVYNRRYKREKSTRLLMFLPLVAILAVFIITWMMRSGGSFP